MSDAATIHAHVKDLIAGVEILDTQEHTGNGFHTVVCMVAHPKREIDATSFVRSAKKKGLIGSGTPSASNRNKLIVGYVTMADGLTLRVKRCDRPGIEVYCSFKV